MKTQTLFNSFTRLGIFGSVLVSFSALGQLLYSDSFTAADGTLGVGRTPDVAVASPFAGNSYTQQGYDYGGYGGTGISEAIYGNAQALRGDFGLKLAFGSAAGFSGLGATQFQISDTFCVNTLNYSASAGNGIGLGFYSATDAGNAWRNFNGLAIDANGNLKLVKNGSTVWASASISGFNATATHTLSYEIDSISGAISSVVLDDNNLTLDFGGNPNNVFTGAALNYTGFYGTQPWNWPSVEYGTVDNFSLAVIPEPATQALAAVGIIFVTLVRRKRSS